MGHIELAAPVSHIWYFKGIPSRMGLILDMSPRSLEKVLYFVSYIVTEPGDTSLMKKQLLTETEYREYRDKYEGRFRASMGAEAIKELLDELDLDKLNDELRIELKEVSGQRRIRAIRRLEVVEAFKQSGNTPSWMILDVVPVIPPELRPMVQLDGGRFATSDLNDLYRRVINRNNRLKRLLDLGAPDIIVRNEKRMLQEAVDALIDNGRRGRPVTGPGNRPLKSLSDMLKGKQGRFRQNLELFKPFVMKKLVNEGHAHNIKSAKRMVERVRPEVWDVLEEVITDHPVLLNRAPTLHRLGIQAFEPILVEGRALQIHPLVCTAYNADFDGDQMAVHVPLSAEAQSEARLLMLSAHNILNPKDGRPVASPTQDMVLGAYYLTMDRPGAFGEGKIFKDIDEATLAYDTKNVHLQAQIKVRHNGELLETTVGRLIFNTVIPSVVGYYNKVAGKKDLNDIVAKTYRLGGYGETAALLDGIKTLGFKYSTRAGITVGLADIQVPKEKTLILKEADGMVAKTEQQFRRGLITDEERYNLVIDTWTKATDKVTKALMLTLDKFNPVYMMATSGARGNIQQLRQLAGMRGLMADPSGRTIELPIKANFREGLTVLEYFISSHGARKGLADTALRTADSGYLTRRLVDVSQDVIVRDVDCETMTGILVDDVKDGPETIEKLEERLVGRYLLEDLKHPETGEILATKDHEITEEQATAIAAVYDTAIIRSVLTCKTRYGVCIKCYGRNLATGHQVELGEAVGIIAAQSIGEPGTQLTMRTFHTGGVAGDDITQGLPRVEELFEARKPKGQAIIAEINGTATIREVKGRREVELVGENEERATYPIPFGSRLKVKEGKSVVAGDELTEGSVNPHDMLKVKGMRGVQVYLLAEVQKVYRLQGVDINDKHIEVMVRQMLRKVKVDEAGDVEGFLPGGLVDVFEFQEKNALAIERGGEPAVAHPVLMGITKASLATDSFLSAASFQETTRVLTEAAIKGKVDPLLGLKENVIIGKLIPAGTGMPRYRNIKITE